MSGDILGTLLGGEVFQVVDVGARGGAHRRWATLGGFVEVVGFDADAEECGRLNAEARALGKRARYLPFALAAADGAGVFHVCRSPGSSSLYRPNKALVDLFPYGRFMEVVATEHVTTTTLDRVTAEHGLAPDELKLDTQGTELDILRGGARTLEAVKLVELEVEFNELYTGQPLFADVDAFMRDHGFLLLGLRRSNWRHAAGVVAHPTPWGGQLVHGDALYYNERRLAGHLGVGDLAKWLMALSVYRQDAFLLHLLHEHPAARALDPVSRGALTRRLIRERPLGWRLLSRVAGRLGHERLRRWVDNLRGAHAVDWHDPDFF